MLAATRSLQKVEKYRDIKELEFFAADRQNSVAISGGLLAPFRSWFLENLLDDYTDILLKPMIRVDGE
tara:strand:+ start:272 stop:475 length:204 start_codon:yes stop_codon:yes gene_type:complete